MLHESPVVLLSGMFFSGASTFLLAVMWVV
jgi:hypothetical protein